MAIPRRAAHADPRRPCNLQYRTDKAKTLDQWSIDKLPRRVSSLAKALAEQYEKPRVFYFHCMAGTDRTGEFAASWKMRFDGWSAQKALDWDDTIHGRPILQMSRNEALWFCWYLTEAGIADPDCQSYVPPSPSIQ